jgi:putative membrane protein
MRWISRLLIVLLLLVVLVIGLLFSVQNATEVSVDLLVLQTSARPLATWLIAAFVAGGIAGLLADSIALLRLQSRQMQLKRRLTSCEKELAQLKAPVAN